MNLVGVTQSFFSHVKPAQGSTGGLITYGALDNVNCDKTVNYVPLSAENWWTFPIDGYVPFVLRSGTANDAGCRFKVGKYKRRGTQQVISDT